MDACEIQAAIDSLPAKKEDLRKAFEVLQSYYSSFSSTLKWNELDDYVCSIEKSIEERFRELEGKERSWVSEKLAAAAPVAVEMKVVEKEPEVKPVLDLKYFCLKMDGKGLRSYILNNWKDLPDFRGELSLSLRAAPNPVMLVLDSLDGFVPCRKLKKKELELIWKTSVHLIEGLQELDLEIKPAYRDRARMFAIQWKGKITNGKEDNWFVVIGFFRLVVTFGLVDSFATDDILDILALVSRRKQMVDMCRRLRFEDKMLDFVEKLKNNGKQLEAVKFVVAFNLSDKHPPASLLEAHVNKVKSAAVQERQRAKSLQFKNFSTKKEIDALKSVIKTVEEYDLGSVYSCEHLHKRIEQLENHHAEWKQVAKWNAMSQNENYEPANKQPRLSDSFAPVGVFPPNALHHQSRFTLKDRSPYHALPHPYSLAAAPSPSAISANPLGLNGLQAPSQPHVFPLDPTLSGSAYHNRATTHGVYSSSTQPPYNSTHFP